MGARLEPLGRHEIFLFKVSIIEDDIDSDSSDKSNADTRAFEQQQVPYYPFNDQ